MPAKADDCPDKPTFIAVGSSDKKKGGATGIGGRPPPVMRNIHHAISMKNLYTAIGLAGTSAVLFYLLWCRKRRYVYSEFYRKYDADAAFERMMNANVLDSCPPGSSSSSSSSDAKKK